MKVLRLQMKDFLSHAETDISMDSLAPLTLILGVSNDQLETSNGAGKSSIFEAIAWGLFGETTRESDSAELVREGQPQCSVKLWLSIDGLMIQVTRTKKVGESQSSSFEVMHGQPWGGSIAEKQARLNHILGMDFSLFRNTYLFGQSEGSEFINATDKGRKEFVCRLLGAGVLELAKKRADEAVSKATHELSDAKAALDSSQQHLESLQKNQQGDANVKEVRARVKKLEGIFASLKAKHDPALGVRIKTLREKDADVGRSLALERQALSGAKERIGGRQITGTIRELAKQGRDAVDEQRSKVWADIKVISDEAKKLTHRISSTEGKEKCPWCLSKLDAKGKAELVRRLKAEIEVFKQKSTEMTIRAGNLEIAFWLIAFDRAAIAVKEQEAKRDAVLAEQEKLKAKLASQAEIESRMTRIDAKLAGLRTALGAIEAAEKMAGQLQATIADLEKKVRVSTFRWKLWSSLQDAFGQHGIRSMLVERAIPLLEAETNSYLRQLSAKPLAVEMDSKVETKSGAVKDKLDLRVIVGERKQSFNSCSGGEKRRVVLALRLAISKLLRMTKDFKHGKATVLLMDEITDDLDTDGLQRLMKLLLHVEKDFERVLVISHNERLRNLMDAGAILWVENKDGISRVRKG